MRPILNFFWPPRSYFLFLGVQDHNVAQITICGHLMLLIEKKEKHKTFRVCNNQEVIAIYFLIWFHYSFTSKKLNGNFRDPYLKKTAKTLDELDYLSRSEFLLSIWITLCYWKWYIVQSIYIAFQCITIRRINPMNKISIWSWYNSLFLDIYFFLNRHGTLVIF